MVKRQKLNKILNEFNKILNEFNKDALKRFDQHQQYDEEYNEDYDEEYNEDYDEDYNDKKSLKTPKNKKSIVVIFKHKFEKK